MLAPDEYGPWRFCDEADLRQVVEGVENQGTKISVMQDAHKARAEDLLPKSESVVDTIRVATYVKDIDKAIALENAARAKGYETTINIMSISIESDWELDPALEQIAHETGVVACYVVDSFGALYSEQVDYFVRKYQRILKDRDLAEDAAQQAFTTACAKMRSLRSLDRFGPWLTTICRNAAQDMARARRRDAALQKIAATEESVQAASDGFDRAVKDAVDGLPPMYREVIVLHYYSGMSYTQIESVLAISGDRVRGRLARARRQIQIHLEREGFHREQ
jgi:RNA polymerase sigma factor (sigma-70 family)